MGQQSIAAAQPRVSRASAAALRLVSFVSFFFVLSSAQTTQTASTEDAHDILHETTTTTTPNSNKTPTIISSSLAAVEKKKMNNNDDICFVTGKPPAHVATPLTARYVPRMQPGDPSCCSPCEAYDLVRCRCCSVSHEQANCCPKPCELYYFVSQAGPVVY